MPIHHGLETHKNCRKCGEYLERAAFSPNAKLKSGMNSWCRQCVVAATKAWRAKKKQAA